MRALVILRGAPGCGKSTWIKEMKLQNYTLCADDIRMLFESPIMVADRHYRQISQANDNLTWELLFDLLDKRMSRGEFVIVDATHSRSTDFSRYDKLCSRYRYRKYYIDFSDIPIEECKKRNQTREAFRRVPDSVIEKIYARMETQPKTTGWVKIDRNKFWDEICVKLFDYNNYNMVHIFGDIHGCFEPLKEYFEKYPYSENDAYIFTGDYIDRGIQNKETLEFLLTLYDKKNVLMLEGNHECITLDTEVLTENGWKKYEEIKDNEKIAQYDIKTSIVDFALPNARIERESKEVVCIEGHNLLQHITKKHNVLYENKLVPLNNIENLNTNNFTKCASDYNNNISYNKNMLKLLTWVVCDGTIVYGEKNLPNNNKCRVQFKLSKQRKIDRLEKILQDNGIEYSIKETKKCGINKIQPYIIRFYGEKAREIYKIIGKEKRFPAFFKYLNKEDLNVVIEELKNTDGYQQNNRLLWSSISKENLDIIQIAAILHGYECNIKQIDKRGMNKKDIYLLTLYLKKQFNGIKTEVKINSLPPQRVCCFNMPKGTLITRTNGIVTITGNCWLKYYSIDEIENIKSHEFKQYTMPQIYDMNLSDLRNFYRKLGQLAYFTFDNQRYIVSHGGIPYIPSEDGGLISIATEQLIKGVGDYKDNIDEIYANNENVCKQIHAHRNIFELDNVNELSYNLEGRVEFGGELRVLQLTKNSKPQMIKIKNNTYKAHEEDKQEEIKEIQNQIPIIEALRLDTKNIQEKDLGNNIHSFNFTRDAFYNKNWNQYTCKARGLFLDVEKQNVAARGYEKFFNINEVRETELEHLLIKFKDKPITLYKKENGFLGIMSWVNGELFVASKSTNEGNFARWFRRLYEKSSINKEVLERYLQDNNVTLLFEVIDVEHDPHIIKYPESKLVLLDVTKNQFEFERLPYEKLVELAKDFNCECKSIYATFNNVRDFHRWYLSNTNEDDMSKEDIEGVVIECGDIMTKLKFPYYNFWKQMRGVKEKVRKKRNVELASLWNATSNYFYHWLKTQPEEELDKDIIYLREKYFSEKTSKGG